MTRIAIAKGRILKDATKLLQAAGYDTAALAADDPSLFRPLSDGLEAMIVRSSDVPLTVERGAAALGITGLDTLAEKGGDLLELLDLGIARCRMCVAGPDGLDIAAEPDRTWRVASKYPRIAARAFAAAGRHCEVVPLSGTVETAPEAGLADVIVDLVDTGRTLKAHGLVIYEEILDVSSRLVAHPTAFFRERAVIGDVLARMEGALGGMMRLIASNDEGFEALFAARVARNAVGLGGEPLVEQVLEDVRRRGDEAVGYWTQKFDGIAMRPESWTTVPDPATIDKLDDDLREALTTAADRIRAYHERLLPRGWFDSTEEGVALGVRITPLERVGIYVPGGKAAYPSSVLMCAVPAKVAGVDEVVMVTPPRGRHLPLILEAAAAIAGVDRIVRVGGAQAVAALTFGTATVPRVDKIVGPGNRYVAEAKRRVFGLVDIDSVAGPSEVLIVADGSVPAPWVAADAIAQAEHDEAAAVIVLVSDADYGTAVNDAVAEQLADNPRAEIARASLETNGLVVVVRDLDEAVALANRYAPEHLELAVADPEALVEGIRHAGAIFMGGTTPEAVGDYLAGPNHVLPTQGTARFFGPLGVDDFLKRTSLMRFDAAALDRYGDRVARLADEEGLWGHANSVRVRRS